MMKASLPIDPTSAPNAAGTHANNGSYSPSVPISVYRELAAELQATQSMLDSLNTQNQQLSQQNQRLRLEVDRLVQASLQAQHVVDAMPQPSWGQPIAASTPSPHRPNHQRDRTPDGDKPLALVTEVPDRYPQRPGSSRSTNPELSNLWFVTAMVLVVVSAFGAGFLIVRPLLSNR